ncbi:hypothetical protein AHAS_Ahas15G0259900 [Arachis hypogaea]
MLYLQPLIEVTLGKYWILIPSHFVYSPCVQLLDVITIGANHEEHGQSDVVTKLVEFPRRQGV